MSSVVISSVKLFFGTTTMEILETKFCSKCGIDMPIDNFRIYGATDDVRRAECKDCEKKLNKLLVEMNKKYGHTKPDRCESCGEMAKLVLDHDHETEEFRGWLCHGCNSGIGWLGDNKEGAQKAVDYFEMVEKRQNNLFI